MNEPRRHSIRMEGISIEFPGVKALSDVDFTLTSGTIHALVGANGAGKSTLMKVLSGAYGHYTGKIFVDGQQVSIRTPRDAKKLGIQIVYQEVDTALIPHLSVAENIMLDVLVNSMGRRQFVSWSQIHASAEQVLRRLNIDLDTRTLIQDLSLAQKQMVLIARAIAEETRFLVLDEPTAPLSNTETEELFRVVEDLAYNHGVGVIFISHRLPELFAICREITVMRDGTVVTSRPMDGLSVNDVVELMLGRKFEESYAKRPVEIGDTLFEVRGLTELNGAVTDVSLTVRSGEIVGVAGLVGAGKTELCKTIFGALPARSGEMVLRGKPLKVTSPFAAVKQGLALVPEERRKEGVLVEESVVTNLTAASLGNFCGALDFINKRSERAAARKVIADLKVKTPSEEQKVAYLSGGNQQKVAVGKWLIADADIYIFDEPTKGVDVGAKREIFDLIGQLAAMGKGIIYASCELSEILAITDRTYVMYDGCIVKELRTAETTEQEILYWSTGGK
ncbi:simple sugar transport system ATP-binding protein [Symbiobacterium terraclitae]|uniref:Simple sugar transport system ATP-binding protein n=1 Tax=Symbiobacterium terraclitae TaxID=557451 RepID=A0ABS4JTV9_9FIRM|nr:simple sugar transport system ATP-binding protein [Symbiobacterium terraclitae]